MSKLSCDIRNRNPIAFNKNWGVSESANALQRESYELQTDFARSITYGEHLAKILEGLFKAKYECSVENWDGYNAKAINNNSFQNAIRFALSLPSNIPNPEIYVDPDGEVIFEWYEGRRQVFSISVGGKNELAYAGLYGASKTYGVEPFYDDIPERLLDNINRLYSE